MKLTNESILLVKMKLEVHDVLNIETNSLYFVNNLFPATFHFRKYQDIFLVRKYSFVLYFVLKYRVIFVWRFLNEFLKFSCPINVFKFKTNFSAQSIFYFFSVNILENTNTISVIKFGLFSLYISKNKDIFSKSLLIVDSFTLRQ